MGEVYQGLGEPTTERRERSRSMGYRQSITFEQKRVKKQKVVNSANTGT
jgi:hypothetical protein